MGPLLLINQNSSANRRRNSTGSKSTGSSSTSSGGVGDIGGGGGGSRGDTVNKDVSPNNDTEDDNKRRGDNETAVIARDNNGLSVTKGLLLGVASSRHGESSPNSSSTEEQSVVVHPSGMKKRPSLSNRDREYNNIKPSNNEDADGGSNKGLMNSGQFFLMNNQTHVSSRSHVSSSTMQMDKSHLHIATGPSITTASNNANNIPNHSKGGNKTHNSHSGLNSNGKKGGGCESTGGMVNSIRKYLVLLQDCLAIKFVPVYQQSHYSKFNDELASNFGGGGSNSNGETEVDHATHGLCLYKGFREANLKCYWNATLCEAIRALEYKGYIVPSIILVFAIPRFLAVLRTAWSRKMLRNPTGYRVEFVGEIEEMIAEPLAQGQFAPLSDSLCWAILELTSSGQEAFVDSIVFALSAGFPTMSVPPRELVYQTLEKLIRERKIYQTSHGYFVVTPDTFRYMNSGGDAGGGNQPYSSLSSSTLPLDALMSSYFESDKLSQHSWGSAGGGSGNEEDIVFCTTRNGLGSLKRHNSLRVIRQRDLDLLMPSMGARSLSFRLSKTKSVFESDRDDKPLHSNKSSTLGSTSASDQMTPTSGKLTSSSEGGTSSQEEKAKTKSRKKASFFKRLFSFRRRSRSKAKPSSTVHSTKPPPPSNATPAAAASAEDSGSGGILNDIRLESLTRSPKIYSSLPRIRTQQRERPSLTQAELGQPPSYEVNEEYFCIAARNRGSGSGSNSNKWNSLPSSANRRLKCRSSILNDSPFYDSLNFDSAAGMNQVKNKPRPVSEYFPLNTGSIYNGGSNHYKAAIGGGIAGRSGNRERYLSGTNLGQRSDSPCPSGIYASIASPSTTTSKVPQSNGEGESGTNHTSLYRKRHPSQGSQQPSRYSSSRPKSAFEILAYQNQQQYNRRKSVESLLNSRSPVKGGIQNNPNGSAVNLRQHKVEGRNRIKSQGDPCGENEAIGSIPVNNKKFKEINGKLISPAYATIGTSSGNSDISH